MKKYFSMKICLNFSKKKSRKTTILRKIEPHMVPNNDRTRNVRPEHVRPDYPLHFQNRQQKKLMVQCWVVVALEFHIISESATSISDLLTLLFKFKLFSFRSHGLWNLIWDVMVLLLLRTKTEYPQGIAVLPPHPSLLGKFPSFSIVPGSTLNFIKWVFC